MLSRKQLDEVEEVEHVVVVEGELKQLLLEQLVNDEEVVVEVELEMENS